MAGMDFREATVGMAEPGARAALVAALLLTGLAGMVVRGDLPGWPAMEATERLEMQPHPMAGRAAREAMWELPDSEAWEEAERPREPTEPMARQ
jgi:hypothetical protein